MTKKEMEALSKKQQTEIGASMPKDGEVFKVVGSGGIDHYYYRQGNAITDINPESYWPALTGGPKGERDWQGRTIADIDKTLSTELASKFPNAKEINAADFYNWMENTPGITQGSVAKDQWISTAQELKPGIAQGADAGASPGGTDALASIRKVFGESWQPSPAFTQQLQSAGIYGAVRIAGHPEVYTLGPGGGWESPETFQQLFGSANQEGIVGPITEEQAKNLGIQMSPGGGPAQGAQSRTTLPPHVISAIQGAPGAPGGPTGGGTAPGGTTPGPLGDLGVDTTGWNQDMIDLFQQLKDMLEEQIAKGQTINPNIEIDETTLAGFLDQANKELDPYYAGITEMAKKDLINTLRYKQESQILAEQQAERGYGRGLEQLGEAKAEAGMAYSGGRLKEEGEWAQTTQEALTQSRKDLAYQMTALGTAAERQYGSSALTGMGFPTLAGTPKVTPGQAGFQYGEESPLYTISGGIMGELEKEKEVAKRLRQSELEQSYRAERALDYA